MLLGQNALGTKRSLDKTLRSWDKTLRSWDKTLLRYNALGTKHSWDKMLLGQNALGTNFLGKKQQQQQCEAVPYQVCSEVKARKWCRRRVLDSWSALACVMNGFCTHNH
jgi:hypothetical protein